MKITRTLRTFLLALCGLFILSCSSQSNIKGTASDKSGTNGATNGTGKIAKGL